METSAETMKRVFRGAPDADWEIITGIKGEKKMITRARAAVCVTRQRFDHCVPYVVFDMSFRYLSLFSWSLLFSFVFVVNKVCQAVVM